MGLNKEELSKLLQATIMAVCENSISFKRQVLIQAVIIVEVDDNKFCSISFRDSKLAEINCSKSSQLTLCNNIAIESTGSNEARTMTCQKMDPKTTTDDGIRLEENVQAARKLTLDETNEDSEVNGSVVNNMFSEAMRVWYNEPVETGSNSSDQPGHADIFPYRSWKNSNHVISEECNSQKNVTFTNSIRHVRRKSVSSSTAKRLFRCEVCSADFTFASNLRRHRKAFHSSSTTKSLKSSNCIDSLTANSATFISQRDLEGSSIHLVNESDPVCLVTNSFSLSDHSNPSTHNSVAYPLIKSEPIAVNETEIIEQQPEDTTLPGQPFNVDDGSYGVGYSPDVDARNLYRSASAIAKSLSVTGSRSENLSAVSVSDTLDLSTTRLNQTRLSSSSTSTCFKCDHCGESFMLEANLQRHVQFYHNDQLDDKSQLFEDSDPKVKQADALFDDRVCQICGKKFFSPIDRKRHVSLAHRRLGSQRIESRLTNHSVTVNNMKRMRLKTAELHTPVVVMPSIDADTSSAEYQASQIVRRGVPLAKYKYSCSVCNARFTFQTNVTRHMKNMHKINIERLPSSERSKKLRYSLPDDSLSHDSKQQD